MFQFNQLKFEHLQTSERRKLPRRSPARRLVPRSRLPGMPEPQPPTPDRLCDREPQMIHFIVDGLDFHFVQSEETARSQTWSTSRASSTTGASWARVAAALSAAASTSPEILLQALFQLVAQLQSFAIPEPSHFIDNCFSVFQKI